MSNGNGMAVAVRHGKSPLLPVPEQVAEREALFAAIFATTVDGIVVIDERGVIESFNPAAERIFGYRKDEAVGQNVSLLMPTPPREQHDGYIQRYLRTGRARIVGIGRQVAGQRKDGSIFPMELAVSEVQTGTRRLFAGIVRDITERKKAEEAITSISEFERQQIGRELHDVIGQDLTGISLMAKVLSGRLRGPYAILQAEAVDIANLASKVTQDVKRLAHGLYPTELEKHGLSSAMRELAINYEHLYRLRCTYEEKCVPPANLDRSAALHLYRIAQEASNNSIRHGEAKHIQIKLDRQENTLVLTVRDDGKGLPEKMPETGGMGFIIMKYRASALGGTFQIRRSSSRGVVVTCQIPWPEGNREN